MNILTNFQVKRLVGNLGTRNQYEHKQTIENLVKIGSPAVKPLVEALNNPNLDRASVIEALGRLGDARAVEPLFEALASACFGAFHGFVGDQKIKESATIALKRIGEPARKYATEMFHRPSEKLRKKLGESVADAFVRQAANLLVEGLEQDGENEQLASKLLIFIRQANLEYNSNRDAYDKTHTEIRKIGEHLCSNGGNDRMVEVANRVKALGGLIRELELHWDDICGWRY
jgi:hypothetical protein